MIKVCLLVLLGLLCWGWQTERNRKGEFDHPIVLPSPSLAKLNVLSDKIEVISIPVMVNAREEERQSSYCLKIRNQSDYVVTKIECEIVNLTKDESQKFTIWPVDGKWIPRNGFRKYFSEPMGIQRWSGNFGDWINLKDRFEIKVLAAYGFQP